MIERFSILQTLDVNKLCHMVYNYMKKTEEKPYIFMSKDTTDAVANIYDNITIEPCHSRYTNGVTAEFEGCKVFTNNDLKFGDIEIR